MKAIKYILMGALLLSTAAPVMAQVDNKAIIEQASTLIKGKGADVDNQIKDIAKKNKKTPEVLVGIGRAYLSLNGDTANAEKYAQQAISRYSKYAPAFILLGDINIRKDNPGEAASNYQNAIYFDPKNPEPYYKYAMVQRGVNPGMAAETLEQLRQQRPDYPVDQLIGHIYYNAHDYEKSLEGFGKVADVTKMEDSYITEYATAAWLLGKRDIAIKVCAAGLQKDPRRAAWNRLSFYNYTDSKNTEKALEFADRLFTKSDSAHFIGEDYTYYGTALQQAKRYDEAITAFNKAIDFNKDNAKTLALLNKNLSSCYLEKGDNDNAIAYMEKAIGGNEKPSQDDLEGLADLDAQVANNLATAGDNAGSIKYLKKADEIYGKLLEAYPAYKNWYNYKRASINANIDPEMKEGLAKPYYEALATSLEAKAERTNSDNAMLKSAYFYLTVYYFNVKQDKATAKEYAAKLKGIDPENDVAKQVLAM